MSYFGQWQCPSCKSTWMGSIGWNPPTDKEDLDKMLLNLCGCEGPIEDAKRPYKSMSMLNYLASDERKESSNPIPKGGMVLCKEDFLDEEAPQDENQFKL